jgi:prostaglandin-endoperoxide synthase 2
MVDPAQFSHESWYRTNWMTIEFSLVYRWHSALPEKIIYNSKEMPIEDTLWSNDLLNERGLGPLFDETSGQAGTPIGLFNTADFLLPVEMASISYGRETQAARYNDYREILGHPRVTDFSQIMGDREAQKLLQELYGDVENIEFYVGLYSEADRKGSAIPLLIERLIAIDAFTTVLTNPLLSDNVFNATTFSDIGWHAIQNTATLADLVHRNVPKKDKNCKVTFAR